MSSCGRTSERQRPAERASGSEQRPKDEGSGDPETLTGGQVGLEEEGHWQVCRHSIRRKKRQPMVKLGTRICPTTGQDEDKADAVTAEHRTGPGHRMTFGA